MNRLTRAVFLLSVLTNICLSQPSEDRYVILITIDGFPGRMFWDAKTPIPRIRQLAAEGVAAEGLIVSNPSVTWPNHTTLVTGLNPSSHSVLYNGILIRQGVGLPVIVDPKRDKAELVAVDTIYDVFHKAGLRTAAIDWPCTRNSNSLDDDFPDAPEPITHMTPRLRDELIHERILADATDKSFSAMSGPMRDQIWTHAACYVIRTRRPNFLLFHLLNTDGIHHRYGPESPASYTALALADFYVGQLLDTLESSGIRKNTTIFVLADHGFATATNQLQPNVLFRQAGLIELGLTNQIAKARAQVVPEGGTGMIYLTNPDTREADRRKVLELLTGKEGVSEIIAPDRFAEVGLPLPEKNPGMADLILVPKDGFAVSGAALGENFVMPVTGTMNLGYHGYLASNDKMNALFVASGRGIKRGVKIGLLHNTQIAPTIATLLGQKLKPGSGEVLTEILSAP